MIGYLTLGTNDMARASEFYDALLGEFGATRFMESENFIAWNSGQGATGLCVTRPFDGKTATAGNGTMVALQADTREKVDTVYARAIELGAKDEGKPGPRGKGFYAGYFRDPDGNKLNVFAMG